jgi:hypothetical protein
MEHRSSPRTRTILQGRVVFNNRFSLIECIVRDLSETGAQIAFSHPITLPSELELEIPKKQLSTRARVMWSNGKVHGLLFTGAVQAEASSNSPVALDESETGDNSLPQQEDASGSTPRIHEVLAEVRNQIAQIAGVPSQHLHLRRRKPRDDGATKLILAIKLETFGAVPIRLVWVLTASALLHNPSINPTSCLTL